MRRVFLALALGLFGIQANAQVTTESDATFADAEGYKRLVFESVSALVSPNDFHVSVTVVPKISESLLPYAPKRISNAALRVGNAKVLNAATERVAIKIFLRNG